MFVIAVTLGVEHLVYDSIGIGISFDGLGADFILN